MFIKITIFVAGLLLGFSIWIYDEVMSYHGPYVKVDVENLSGAVLKRIEIKSGKTVTYTENVEASDTQHFMFYLAGEGGYTVKAIYENGSFIECGSGYIESGYELKDIIYPDHILTQALKNKCFQK